LGGRGAYSPARAAEMVQELISQTQLHVDPSAVVDTLSVAAQQRLEILKAVGRRACILILDEPSAVLAPAEARELLAWLRACVPAVTWCFGYRAYPSATREASLYSGVSIWR